MLGRRLHGVGRRELSHVLFPGGIGYLFGDLRRGTVEGMGLGTEQGEDEQG
ncbi:hypothetical protein GCM10009090_03630 [[Pseudomonas] boreopolis]|uniref:Uncharacterized protein n=1 Tax=Xanthomonas boreopolis TaxID=86183 RepID=A0A919F4T7_9XANT|nr:hypothetical protein GCM10009090_03630 [[Pseudomonas] boreopolis]